MYRDMIGQRFVSSVIIYPEHYLNNNDQENISVCTLLQFSAPVDLFYRGNSPHHGGNLNAPSSHPSVFQSQTSVEE